MDNITGNIMQILHECHPNKDDFEDESKDSSKIRKSKKNIEKEKLEEIKKSVEKLLWDTRCNYIGSVEYASLNKMLAMYNLEVLFGNENI